MNYNGYHFTGNRLRDGRPVPPIGETLVHEGEIVWCRSGFYASPTAWDALPYALGERLHRVLCEDIERAEANKFVCRRLTIIATIDATDLLRKFARKCALDVIHLWDAPQVVVDYLTTGDETLRKAAQEAARAAARSTAWASRAARAAARAAREATAATCDAARAAWTTAWEAAGAALDATWTALAALAALDAAGEAQKARFNDMVDAAFDGASK